MEYSIRKAKIGDEKTLAYIQAESWKAGFKNILPDDVLIKCTEIDRVTNTYRKMMEENKGNGYILFVDDSPHLIAWWGKSRSEEMKEYAELFAIHSLPDRWRMGFGRKMMDEVLNDMKEAGYKKAMLWVFAENERARKFYEAKGFKTEGKTKPNVTPIEICYEKAL